MSTPTRTLGQPVHPAEYLETLARLKSAAHRLLDAIVREESGIRAGDGRWYDGNPVTQRICELVELHLGGGRPWSGALIKTAEGWRHEPGPSASQSAVRAVDRWDARQYDTGTEPENDDQTH